MKWHNPPPVSIVAGTERFLREREIRRGVLIASRKYKIINANCDGDVVDSMTLADTFGEPTLVTVYSKDVEEETLQSHLDHPSPNFKILLRHDQPLQTISILERLHAAHTIEYNTPATRKGCIDLARKFCTAEAKNLGEGALEKKLAEALVRAVGTDLGVLNFEMSKAVALARFMNRAKITAADLRLTLKPSSDLNIMALKEALVSKDRGKILLALEKMRRSSASDPVMILLRAKTGPVALALEWLAVGTLRKGGSSMEEISARTQIPEWKLKKESLPAIRRWGTQNLRGLIGDLGRVEMQVFRGGPSPWAACVSSLMLRSIS